MPDADAANQRSPFRPSRRKASWTLPCIASALLLSACAQAIFSTDVTNNSRMHIGYVPGQVHVLEQEVIITECVKIDGKMQSWVHPEDSLLVGPVPDSCMIIGVAKEEVPDDFAVVPRGSRLKVKTLRLHTFQTTSDDYRIIAAEGVLIDSQFAGRAVILTHVSDLIDVPGKKRYFAHSPRPGVIRPDTG